MIRTVLALGLAFTTGLPVGAQNVRSLDPGTRVRVRLDRQVSRIIWLVADTRPDTLVLAPTGDDFEAWRTFPVSEIAELEVSGGRRRLTFLGIGIGLVSGAVLAAAYNGIVQSQCFNDCPSRVSPGTGAAIGGAVFGLGFHFLRPEKWHRIALPNRSGEHR